MTGGKNSYAFVLFPFLGAFIDEHVCFLERCNLT